MSNFLNTSPPHQQEGEQQIDETSILNTLNSPTANRAHPGAVLLSPQAKPGSRILSPEPFKPGFNSNSITSPGTNSSMALLSPPGSRYAFEPQDNNAMSPLLNPQGAFGNNRPLSAQDFNYNNDTFLNNRPLSAQGFSVPERPLSSMEIDSMTFKNDVANLISWITTLNSSQHKTVIDNLLGSLPEEILNYTRSKLDSQNYDSRFVASPNSSSFIFQPGTQEPLTLDAVLNGGSQSQIQQQSQPWSPSNNSAATNIQRALSPNFTSTFDRSYLNDLGSNRPRSADPYSSKLFNRSNNNNSTNNLGFNNEWDSSNTPSKSRTSRFDDSDQLQQQQQLGQAQGQSGNYENRSFDITNLAQQLTQTPIKYNDYNNSNALKLSALSTINSRAQLDSNKKRIFPTPQAGQQGATPTQQQDERGRSSHNGNVFQTVAGQRFFNAHDENSNSNNNRNAMSVPPPQRVNYYENVSLSPSVSRVLNKQRSQTRMNHSESGSDGLSKLASLNNATKNLSLNDDFQTPFKQQPKDQQPGTPRSPAINAKQITSLKLLNDIGGWLKSLRLHKYTSALQTTHWKELIYLDDKQLEDKGVTAMGARGKLLKAFEIVRAAYENGEIHE